jgi:fatty acid desaturase
MLQNIRPPRPNDWWSPRLERATVKQLLARRDLPGVATFLVWALLVALSTWLLSRVLGSLWVAPAVLLQGALLSFAYAASHEGAHGTAFRTVWLNEAVFYITSFVFFEEPMYRRYTHARHHAATWYPGSDSQMPYRNPITLRAYLRETLALAGLLSSIALTFRLARGKLTAEEQGVIPAAKLAQLRWGARGFLAGYLALFAVAAWAQSAFIIVALPVARMAGGWVVQLFINSQHMCMAEAVPDHRYCTRSMLCWLPTRVLYWNMNFHIEHHLYPGIPFHTLPAVNRLIADELPRPSRGVLGANGEILRVIARQTSDPAFVSQPRFAAE